MPVILTSHLLSYLYFLINILSFGNIRNFSRAKLRSSPRDFSSQMRYLTALACMSWFWININQIAEQNKTKHLVKTEEKVAEKGR